MIFFTIDVEDSANAFYVNCGTSDHLIPSRTDLNAHQTFAKPVENSAANSLCLRISDLRVASSADGREREGERSDAYYTPGIQARLVSFGKL